MTSLLEDYKENHMRIKTESFVIEITDPQIQMALDREFD